MVTTQQSILTRWFDTRIEHKEFRKVQSVLTKLDVNKKGVFKEQKERGYSEIREFLKGTVTNPNGRHLTQITQYGKYNRKWVK
jgi:hypothetical protein